ncbi:MAG: translational GTPase TypA, partial [Acidobacteria bacterium]|nr:translational GTPase TypA [Acidobacteriota bacterium]
GHPVVVVINKIDVPQARPNWVLNHTFDLFIELGATEEQAEFPVIYTSAVQGKAGLEPHLETMTSIEPLFELIAREILPPRVSDSPMQMLVVNTLYDNFKGHIAVGLLLSQSIRKSQPIMQIKTDGTRIPGKALAVMAFDGLNRVEVDTVHAGNIVAVAGIENVKIGETLADFENPVPLAPIQIDHPTVKMIFSINTSPLSGKEGEYSTARLLKARLEREPLSDVALRVTSVGNSDTTFEVCGRGELHLSIFIEKMRREGYEFQVGRPEVIFREMDGLTLEPFEDVHIECPEEFSGSVIEKMGRRRAELREMKVERGVTYMHFLVSTRGLIGYRSEFLTDTKGEGILDTLFHDYLPLRGEIRTNPHGSLVAFESGIATLHGLLGAQERGQLFIHPGTETYEGMIVGQN